MKTSISIPDELFHDAESLARQLKISRSELYARAVGAFIARRGSDSITEKLDRVCAVLGDGAADPFVTAAGRRVMERTEWE